MRKILQDLCDILEEQKTILGNLLELAKEERDIIVKNQSDKLENVIRLEFKELGRLGSVEKRRMAVINAIAMDFNVPFKDITITQIAQLAGPDESAAITKLQKELVPLIEEHTAINKENRTLIEAHVEYSQLMLELMVGYEDPLNNMYSGDGKTVGEQRKTTGMYDGHA